MTRRSGLTLIEVLVAIFVMGIGLIALLTLFPIGILQMMQAIRQDNCARAGLNADSISILQNIRNDPLVITSAAPNVADYFKNPRPGAILPNADDYAASYAIMVDPHGYLATAATPASQRWIGGVSPVNAGTATGGLTRRPCSVTVPPLAPNFAAQSTAIKQWFTLPDDPVFDNNSPPTPLLPGTPKLFTPTGIVRDTPFTWTYLLQRPRTGDPSVVNCTIVVFENRPLLLTSLGQAGVTALTLPEYVYQGATFDLPTNTITVTTAVQPNVRPGDWLYDSTIILPQAPVKPFPEIASAFYRVVAVDDMPPLAAGFHTVRYEVQQPLRKMVRDPLRVLYPNTVIVMDGISEVFDKGPMRLP